MSKLVYTRSVMRKKSYKLSKNELFKINSEVTARFLDWVKSHPDISETKKNEVIKAKIAELNAMA